MPERASGYAYRAYGASLAQELGIVKADFALMAEVGRVARLWMEYSDAAKVFDAARRQQRSRKGKPPSVAQLDRLAHRAHVASRANAEALASIKADEMVKARGGQAPGSRNDGGRPSPSTGLQAAHP